MFYVTSYLRAGLDDFKRLEKRGGYDAGCCAIDKGSAPFRRHRGQDGGV